MTPCRLFRPQPPEHFKNGVVALLDLDTNVVTFDAEFLDLRNSRDFGFLNQLDHNETFLVRY